MNKTKKRNVALSLIAVTVFILLLALLDKSSVDRYYIRILQYWAIYVIFGASFQLLYGYSGLLSLGHAGLIAIGSYTVALLTLSPEVKQASFLFQPPIPFIANVQMPFLPALLIAGIMSAIVGFIVAAPALRLGGDYLAMVTLGFAEVIRLVIVNVPTVFNGAMGLRSIPRTVTLPVVWIFAIITAFVLKRLETANFGRALLAVNEDEIGAEALGISIFSNKVLSFVISSFFAGIGGGLFANILGTIDPNTFKSNLTYAAVAIVVLGGLRSMTGVILAAGIYTIMSEFLRLFETPLKLGQIQLPGIPGMRVLIFGLMLILLMLFKRNGILGSKEFSWDWFFGLFKKRTKSAGNISDSTAPGGKS